MLDDFLISAEIKEREVVRRVGGLIPYGIRENLVSGKVIKVGDSAGLASPLHGGGIDAAVISGKLAISCLQKGEPNSYGVKLHRLFANRLNLEKRMVRLWEELEFEEMEQIVDVVLNNRPRHQLYKVLGSSWWQELSTVFQFFQLFTGKPYFGSAGFSKW